MILIICAWIYYFFLSLSIGAGILNIISRYTGRTINTAYGIFYQFWFGFAMIIGLLQLVSIFLPVGMAVFVMVSLLGIVFALTNYKSVGSRLAMFYKWAVTPKGIISLLVTCLILFLVAYSANKEVTHTDTFIYHFNAVKWAKEYPAVPGLVNLHNRLGFNSSFFLFAAFTEPGIYANYSAHIALSFIMVMCALHFFFIVSNPAELMSKRIFCLMTFIFLVQHIGAKMDIASLSTDYPMAALTMIFCLVLLDKINYKLLLLLPLAAVIFTFKLSGMLAILVGITIMVGRFFFFRRHHKSGTEKKGEIRMTGISMLIFCLIMSGFIIRNIIVSGWLLYPFPIGNLHLEWSTPKEYVLNMLDWIQSYPKIPGGASPETIHSNNFIFWFGQWYNYFTTRTEFYLFTSSLFILLAGLIQAPSLVQFIRERLYLLTLVLFSFASLVMWFTSAPDIRFGSIYFYLFFASSIIFFYESSKHKDILKVLIYGGFVYQMVFQMPVWVLDRKPELLSIAQTIVPKLVKVVASPPHEKPALIIYMPAEGNQCGNSPIPCTPYAGGLLHSHMNIRQRVPGNLSKGFLPPEK